MKKLLYMFLCLSFIGLTACGVQQEETQAQSLDNSDTTNYEALDENSESEIQEQYTEETSIDELSDDEMLEQFYLQFYGDDWNSEDIVERLADRGGCYQASCYYDDITYYWEIVRGITDISNFTDPLYFTDMRYYAAEDFADATPTAIHLAKNEIYAKHGYIFKSEDLNNYFLGCAWYTPTCIAEEFDDSIFNDYERANLELLAKLDEEGFHDMLSSGKISVEAGWEFLKSVHFPSVDTEEISYDENGAFQAVIGRFEMPFSEDDVDRPCEAIVFFDSEEDGYYLFGHYYVFYDENGEVFATRTRGWYKVDYVTGGIID